MLPGKPVPAPEDDPPPTYEEAIKVGHSLLVNIRYRNFIPAFFENFFYVSSGHNKVVNDNIFIIKLLLFESWSSRLVPGIYKKIKST